MSTASVADLVELLRKGRLLEPARLEQVIKAQARFPDALTLAKELVRRGWLTREQARELLKGRPAPPPIPPVPATNAAEPPAPTPGQQGRRRGGWLLALLAILLLSGAVGLALWWHGHGAANATDQAIASNRSTDVPPPADCSDDVDPKHLERLEFGKSIRADFDGKYLTSLKDKPIPEVEVYPWQPKDLVAILGEHRMRGTVIAASPDGTLLAVAGGQDTFIRIGPVESLHEKAVLAGHGGGMYALAWSPTGKVLASSSGDGMVRLWDVRNPDKVPEPVVLEKAVVTSLAFSHDGKYLIGGGPKADQTGTLWVWDAGKGQLLHKLDHGAPVQGVAFSPVDYRVLSGGGQKDGKLYLWDAVRGGEPLTTIDFKSDKFDGATYVGRVAFSPDGRLAVSGHYDKDLASGKVELSARVWDLGQLKEGKQKYEPGQEKHLLKGFVGADPLLAFAPDGKTIATARSSDGGVWLWDADSGKQVRSVATSSGVYSLMFLPRDEQKADRVAFAGTVSGDWNVHVHEAKSGKELRPPVGHLAAVLAVAVSPDGQHVASGAFDGTARVWDLEKVAQRHAVSAGGQVWNVGFHPDSGKAFYCGAGTATVPFVDVGTGKAWGPAYTAQHGGAVNNAVVTPDGNYVLTGGYQDATVRLWSLKDGKQVRYFPSAANGTATVALSPDWRKALRTSAGALKLLHLRCQEVRHEWGAGAWNTFLPDGRVAILGGTSGPLWDVTGEQPKEAGSLPIALAGAPAGDISPDGRRLAAVVAGRAVVFDLKSERPEIPAWGWTPPAHFGGVRAVALSADGRYLLTANGDGTVYVIQLP